MGETNKVNKDALKNDWNSAKIDPRDIRERVFHTYIYVVLLLRAYVKWECNAVFYTYIAELVTFMTFFQDMYVCNICIVSESHELRNVWIIYMYKLKQIFSILESNEASEMNVLLNVYNGILWQIDMKQIYTYM